MTGLVLASFIKNLNTKEAANSIPDTTSGSMNNIIPYRFQFIKPKNTDLYNAECRAAKTA